MSAHHPLGDPPCGLTPRFLVQTQVGPDDWVTMTLAGDDPLGLTREQANERLARCGEHHRVVPVNAYVVERRHRPPRTRADLGREPARPVTLLRGVHEDRGPDYVFPMTVEDHLGDLIGTEFAELTPEQLLRVLPDRLRRPMP